MIYTAAVAFLGSGHSLTERVNEANGAIHRFKARLEEHYGRVDLDMLSEQLSNELWGLQYDANVASRAQTMYASDLPFSRGIQRVAAELHVQSVRFFNHSGRIALKDVPDEQPKKGETAASIHEALSDAAVQLEAVQLAWPAFENAWSAVEAQLNASARSPQVVIANRETPLQAPRPLPSLIYPRIAYPQTGKLFATAPGSQVYIDGPDTLGILLGLMKDEISAKLRQNLEAQYAAAKSNGQLILSAADKAAKLKVVQAELARLERVESVLLWQHVAKTGIFPAWMRSEMKPDMLLGIARGG